MANVYRIRARLDAHAPNDQEGTQVTVYVAGESEGDAIRASGLEGRAFDVSLVSAEDCAAIVDQSAGPADGATSPQSCRLCNIVPNHHGPRMHNTPLGLECSECHGSRLASSLAKSTATAAPGSDSRTTSAPAPGLLYAVLVLSGVSIATLVLAAVAFVRSLLAP